MNSIRKDQYFRCIVLGVSLALLCAPNPAWAAQTQNAALFEHCSVALITQAAGRSENVCDLDRVKKLAAQGSVFEQNQMGIASVLAIGPRLAIKDAVQWFQQAAQKGYAPAQVNLAALYANGWGVPRNYGKALYWFRAAADQGSARALYNLGVLYMKGEGVGRDYQQALRYFQKGADACDFGAQTNLAYLYDRGLGVKHDPNLAAAWYAKAAHAGDAMAQHNLGDMYLRGEGVAQSDAQALALFEKAALQGHTGGQIMLGYMLAEGRGTPKDLESAYRWIAAASRAGDNRGHDLLRSLKSELGDDRARRALESARPAPAKVTQTTAAASFLQLAAMDLAGKRGGGNSCSMQSK